MTTEDPSEDEIAALCLEVQAGWSEHERRKRAAWMLTPSVVASVVDDDVIEAAGTD